MAFSNTIWFKPEEGDTIAFITEDRIAEIGGASQEFLNTVGNGLARHQHIVVGLTILQKWMRLNCKMPGTAVTTNYKTGIAFKNENDALMFKLVWG